MAKQLPVSSSLFRRMMSRKNRKGEKKAPHIRSEESNVQPDALYIGILCTFFFFFLKES